MSRSQLYSFPDVYGTLLEPEPETWKSVQRWLRTYLPNGPGRVLDPACGPGNWLRPFADLGAFVAGNDIEPKMVAYAEEFLADRDSLFVVGDMRDLHFDCPPFDLCLNMDCSVGHLDAPEDVLAHLQSLAQWIAPGGVYFLSLMVADGDMITEEHEELYTSPWLPVPRGGDARVIYHSVRRDPVAHEEHIQMRLETLNVPEVPALIEESYVLQTFPLSTLAWLLEEAEGWELEGVHSVEWTGLPQSKLQENCGDVLLVLRRLP